MALTEKQQAFVEKMMPYALAASQQTGIDPRVIIGQAALESAWGSAAPNNNYFGIKGPGQSFATTEYYGGKATPETASFRAYGSPQESFQSYADLLSKPFYSKVREAQGMDAQLQALGRSGYATDPRYGDLVGSIARQIDVGPQTPPAPPPLPNLRPNAVPSSLYAGGGLTGGGNGSPWAAQGLDQFAPKLAYADFTPQPQAASAPPPPPGLPPISAANPDVLGGGGSKYGRAPDPYGQMELTNTGPFGFGELINAIARGAPEKEINAIGDKIAADIGKLPALGFGGPTQAGAAIDIGNYIRNVVPKEAPGAVRYLKEAFATNPELAAKIPAQLKPSVDKAFASSVPSTATSPYAMPNLRPPMPSSIPQTPPLVASAPPMDTAPKMAAFGLPPKSGESVPGSFNGFTPGANSFGPSTDSFDQSIPSGASYSLPPPPTMPTERLAQLFSYPTQQPSGGTSYVPPPPPTPRVQMPQGASAAGNALLGLSPALPSSAYLPPPAATPGVGAMSYLTGGLPKASFAPAPKVASSWMPPKPVAVAPPPKMAASWMPPRPTAASSIPPQGPPPLPDYASQLPQGHTLAGLLSGGTGGATYNTVQSTDPYGARYSTYTDDNGNEHSGKIDNYTPGNYNELDDYWPTFT